MPRRSKVPAPPPDVPFAELPTLAVERLASALSRSGELMYQRLFGLHLSECRVLAVVLSHEPTSLSEVCEQLELDKGHVSRLVTKLVAQGLLERHLHSTDQRASHLVLTVRGQEVALRIKSAAAARNREWLAVLGEAESATFLATVGTMTGRAHEMLADEVGRSNPSPALSSRWPPVTKASMDTTRRPLVVDRPVLEEMRRRLDQLLGDDPDARGRR